MMAEIIVDAEKQILGRMASEIAKILLNESESKVIVINAEKAVVTGNKRFLVGKYKQRAELRTNTNPLAGPFYPRSPDVLVRRTVRGMLPWKKYRGREAYRRLKVYIGVPDNVKKNKVVQFDQANGANLKSKHMTTGDIAIRIGGYKPEV